ncbi:hypothetical protein D3C76_1583900 [compost metagenome]
MMEEQQQVIRTAFQRLILFHIRFGVLGRITSSGGCCAVNTNPVTIRKVIRAPHGILISVYIRPVMMVRVDHISDAQRGRIRFIDLPRIHQYS